MIPETAVLKGTARTLTPQVRDLVERRIVEVVEATARLHGAMAVARYKRGYPVLWTEASFLGDTLTVTIRQQPNHASEKGPFVFKLPIVAHRVMEGQNINTWTEP